VDLYSFRLEHSLHNQKSSKGTHESPQPDQHAPNLGFGLRSIPQNPRYRSGEKMKSWTGNNAVDVVVHIKIQCRLTHRSSGHSFIEVNLDVE
jgi:hypothetical protein